MAYTRDWDETAPVDHTKFKVQPSHVRDFKIDVSDRIKNLISGFTAGETDEGFKKVPYLVQGTAPSSASNMMIGFGSDVAAKCELFLIDEDGHVIQVTSAGKVRAGILGTKILDEAAIASDKIIYYNGTSGQLEYRVPHAVYA